MKRSVFAIERNTGKLLAALPARYEPNWYGLSDRALIEALAPIFIEHGVSAEQLKNARFEVRDS